MISLSQAAVYRALIYLALTVVGFLVVASFWQYFMMILMCFTVLFYICAYVQDLYGGKGMAGGTNDEIASAAGSAGAGYATEYARNNPDKVAAAMKDPAVQKAALNAV